MPITALDIMGGVSSVIKSKKQKRKERRKKRKAKAQRRAQERNELNAGFNPGVENVASALDFSSREGEESASGSGSSNNMIMYIVGAFLIYKFLLKK